MSTPQTRNCARNHAQRHASAVTRGVGLLQGLSAQPKPGVQISPKSETEARSMSSHLITSHCRELSAATPPLDDPFELIPTGSNEVLL